MTEVVPGIALPYEVNFGVQGLLYVAMTVFDESGPSPVLVQGPSPMLNTAGGMYRAKFTATAGKSYSILKTVYTDGTYTVRDDDYAEGSETIYGKADPAAAQLAITDLTGVVSDIDELTGTVEDSSSLTGTVADADEII